VTAAPQIKTEPTEPAAPAAPVAQSAPTAEPAPPAQSVRAAEAGPDTHALYKKAHQAHFTDKNPGAALRAWDDYLRADPRGRFSVEAHYNRALCLVRLGRSAEARRALDAFARGAFGGYRQAEARALLEALGGDAPR
jgi:TolA-binding protein